MKKRVLFLLMSFSLLFSALSVPVSASATTEAINTGNVLTKTNSDAPVSSNVEPQGWKIPGFFYGEVLERALDDLYDWIKTDLVEPAIRWVTYHFKENGLTENGDGVVEEVKIKRYEFDPRDRLFWVGDNYTTRGTVVLKLQDYLDDGPYNPGPVDGYWGPRTKSAVKDFQYDARITVDGVVGTHTWIALVKFDL